MAKQWTHRQYGQHCEAIENKYEPLLIHYRRFVSRLSSEEIRDYRDTTLFQRVQGFYTAFQIIGAQSTREGAVQILESQIAEPSVPDPFRQAVQFVLDDLNTDVVAPITLQALLK